MLQLPADERAWLIFHKRRELIHDARLKIIVRFDEIVKCKPIAIVHPSYVRFLKYRQAPFFVQVSL